MLQVTPVHTHKTPAEPLETTLAKHRPDITYGI